MPVPCDSCLHCIQVYVWRQKPLQHELAVTAEDLSIPLMVSVVLCRFKEYQDLAQLRFNFAGEPIIFSLHMRVSLLPGLESALSYQSEIQRLRYFNACRQVQPLSDGPGAVLPPARSAC